MFDLINGEIRSQQLYDSNASNHANSFSLRPIITISSSLIDKEEDEEVWKIK